VTQSAEEAVQELTEALREGEEGGLRKYGIAVQQGATRAQTFESALRQMREAAQGTDPALRTASESMDAMSSGATDAVSALAALAAQGLGLNNVVNNLSTDIRRLGDDLTELAARRATAARYAREYLATSPALEQNRTLFRAAAGLGRANS
jgi:predicted RNase H-like HicB family nuclease